MRAVVSAANMTHGCCRTAPSRCTTTARTVCVLRERCATESAPGHTPQPCSRTWPTPPRFRPRAAAARGSFRAATGWPPGVSTRRSLSSRLPAILCFGWRSRTASSLIVLSRCSPV